MCVIITNPSGKLPTIDILRSCEQANDDGIGLAWLTDKGVSFRKGIKFKHLVKLLVQVEVKKLPYVIHFRAATQGGVAARLCHPFPLTTKWEKLDALSGDGLRAVVAHNGTWRSWQNHFPKNEVDWLETNNWSDSAIIAWMLAAGKEISLPVGGYGNRLAFLSRKRGIVHWGDGWKEEDGIHYSNTFWRYRGSVSVSYYGAYGGSHFSPSEEADLEWLSYATQNGWNVGTVVGENGRGGRVLHHKRSNTKRYIAQDGTSYCHGHKCFDGCWKQGGYTEAQAAADLASAGACEIEKANKELVKLTNKEVLKQANAAPNSGLTRNWILKDEVIIQTKIYRRSSNGVLIYTGDKCFEKQPTICAAEDYDPLPLPESGNAEDRAVMEIKNK